MIKYLEIPDLHYHPKWGDIIKSFVPKILEQDIDFIAMPGDLFEAPIMNTDKGGINEIREIIKQLAQYCPVVAIEGTPSHDGPGCYGFLEEVGLTLLKPGKTYGLMKGFSESVIVDVEDVGITPFNAVLFGIPELNKNNIMSKLNLTAEQANAEAENLFYDYVDSYIAPMRLKYKYIPAICLCHGNFSDARKENSSDIILKSSDIVIHTERLKSADITRWSLGHIHKPWESNNISAGYAGSWGKSWGETDFLPAMNLVSTDSGISRIPYGTPKRVKIYKPLSEYDKNIAYWLESSEPDPETPAGHEWSKATYKQQKKETRRIEIKAETMEELFKAIYPEVSNYVLKKVSSIDIPVKIYNNNNATIELLNVEISNCVLFNERTVKLNLDNINTGLNEIKGGNGTGKSSLLSFCTPYPVLVGKQESKSIKQFFDGNGSIIKTIKYNNEIHEHKIFISKSKVECYLIINNESKLDKGSFDEMKSACNDTYGSFEDYLLTSFYVQPQQGKYNSGLMGVSMVDIRNVVQNIAGIDREQEKRFALDKVSLIEKDINDIKVYINTGKDFIIDTKEIKDKIKTSEAFLDDLKLKIEQLTANGKGVKFEVERYEAAKIKNDAEIERKKQDEEKRENIITCIELEEDRIENLDIALRTLDANRKLLSDIEEFEKLRSEYEKELDIFANDVIEIKNITNEIANLENMKRLLDKKCPECGYIDPENKAKINDIDKKISDCTRDKNNVKAISPEPFTLTKPEGNISIIKSNIEKALSAETLKTEILKNIDKMKTELTTNNNYNINNNITQLYNTAKAELEDLKEAYTNTRDKSIKLETEINELNKALAKSIEADKMLEEKKRQMSILKNDLADWKYIAAMLQPAKIPALELEIILDTIDSEATNHIEALKYGRFSFQTETQKVGSKSLVDKFDIKVHDAETGKIKSFLDHSPGEKAFLSDAYIKALVSQRNNRSNITYSPIILDEADGPIQPELIPDFYDMQKNYWNNSRVLLVSHNPASHEHIQNTIFMEELFNE